MQNEDFRYPEHLTTILDLQYTDSNSSAHTMDLFFDPTKIADSNPCIVWIHGGGWRFGDKRDTVHRLYEFAANGYVCATINYRLTDEDIFPAQIIDCRNAIRFLRQNSAKFKIQPNAIGAWGGSAGGHLAALLGAATPYNYIGDDGPNNLSHTVQAVCTWFGAFDLLKMEEFPTGVESRIPHMTADSLDGLLVGGDVRDKADLVALANPTTFLDGSEPPFFIMHGTDDDFVPVTQSSDLHKAMLAKGSDSTLFVIPRAGHNGEGFTDHHIRMVLDFFDWKLRIPL